MFFDLANLCIENGLFDEALEHFQASISADPQFIDSYLTLSQFLSTMNRDEDALQYLHGAKSIFEANLIWSRGKTNKLQDARAKRKSKSNLRAKVRGERSKSDA